MSKVYKGGDKVRVTAFSGMWCGFVTGYMEQFKNKVCTISDVNHHAFPTSYRLKGYAFLYSSDVMSPYVIKNVVGGELI